MRNLECIFIRHGITQGNKEKRYIGNKTDEPLCEEGKKIMRKEAELISFENEDFSVFISPMKRCKQSAQILFPNRNYIEIEGFQEIDFGDFEGKNYKELTDNPEYIKWIETNGILPFPNGESRERFVERTVKAFESVVNSNAIQNKNVFVIHGGSIMAIMSMLTGGDYFSFQLECGSGYIVECCVEEGKINALSYSRLLSRGNS